MFSRALGAALPLLAASISSAALAAAQDSPRGPLPPGDFPPPADRPSLPHTLPDPGPGAEPFELAEFDLAGLLAESTIVQQLESGPTAVGPAYRANFTAAGLHFTPQMPLDREGRHLRFAFESIRVGDVRFDGLDLAAEPHIDGERIVFERGRGVREVYEPRLDGLEQSFEFDALPSRAGDLVVRGRLACDFATPLDSGRVPELQLGDSIAGGVRLTKVLGRDARGAEAVGAMRIAGDAFELSLPAEWVAEAELPLVLDPLIGSLVDVTQGFNSATRPDMAYGVRAPTAQAVVFERNFSSTDVDIQYIELGGSGQASSLIKILEGQILPTSASPSIGFCRATQQYLAVWESRATIGATGDILGRSIWLNGGLSATVSISSTAFSEISPQVGSESTTFDDEVLVVWNTVGAIRVTQVNVQDGLTPGVFTPVTVDSSSDNTESNPAISASGGNSGRYVVAWQKNFGTDRDIRTRVVDWNTTLLGDVINYDTIGPDEQLPRVDGADGVFLVAYMRDPALGAADYDIEALRLEVDTFGAVTSSVRMPIDAADAELDRNPAVAFTGNRFYVAWEDTYNGFGYDIAYVGLDAQATAICEPRTLVTNTGDTNVFPDFAPRFAGGASEGFADLVFQRKELTSSSPKVVFQGLGTFGGPVTNLGGGCGGGGLIDRDGEFLVGNPDLRLTLSGADPTATLAILNWGAPATPIPCGACQFKPFKNVIFETASGGSASAAFGLPCNPILAGRTAEFQWTLVLTGDTPCFSSPNVSFSDRLQGVISF